MRCLCYCNVAGPFTAGGSGPAGAATGAAARRARRRDPLPHCTGPPRNTGRRHHGSAPAPAAARGTDVPGSSLEPASSRPLGGGVGEGADPVRDPAQAWEEPQETPPPAERDLQHRRPWVGRQVSEVKTRRAPPTGGWGRTPGWEGPVWTPALTCHVDAHGLCPATCDLAPVPGAALTMAGLAAAGAVQPVLRLPSGACRWEMRTVAVGPE